MAIKFDGTNYLKSSSPPITSGGNFTWCAWVKRDATTPANAILSMGDESTTDNYRYLYDNGAGSVGTGGNDGGVGGFARALQTVSGTDTWQHWAGTENSTGSSKYAYVDGSAGTLDNEQFSPTSLDNFLIGALERTTVNNQTTYAIAEVAFWSHATDDVLTPAEIAMLAAGVSPLLVRPQDLVRYYPLTNASDLRDIVGGATMTEIGAGALTDSAHPRIIQPTGQLVLPPVFHGIYGTPTFDIDVADLSDVTRLGLGGFSRGYFEFGPVTPSGFEPQWYRNRSAIIGAGMK